MSVQYDSTPRAVADASNVATTLGAASLGGTIAVRVIIDDAVIGSKDTALRHIEAVIKKITEQTWPAA
jgi:hypothetical protein